MRRNGQTAHCRASSSVAESVVRRSATTCAARDHVLWPCRPDVRSGTYGQFRHEQRCGSHTASVQAQPHPADGN